jgi:predicted HTH transcriptional regulator
MGGDRERNEGGQFEPEYTDEEVVEAVAENEPAGTTEVADELGIARQSADYRLRRLLDDDRVSKKKVGNSLVWSVDE